MQYNAVPGEIEYSSLLAGISRGDLGAFNQLVLRHQDMAYHHALALLSDPDKAEDATQEAIISAWRNIHSFKGGSFAAWLLRIVTNACYDEMRRMKRHPQFSLEPEDAYGEELESPSWLADPAFSPEAQVEQQQYSSQVYAALDALSTDFRSVLTLVDVYELDYAEAAAILKVPLGTVKSRLARARLAMRERLRQV